MLSEPPRTPHKPNALWRGSDQRCVAVWEGSCSYGDFILGYGGPVAQFEPPAAYWAVERPPAGGGCKYEVPQAVVLSIYLSIYLSISISVN